MKSEGGQLCFTFDPRNMQSDHDQDEDRHRSYLHNINNTRGLSQEFEQNNVQSNQQVYVSALDQPAQDFESMDQDKKAKEDEMMMDYYSKVYGFVGEEKSENQMQMKFSESSVFQAINNPSGTNYFQKMQEFTQEQKRILSENFQANQQNWFEECKRVQRKSLNSLQIEQKNELQQADTPSKTAMIRCEGLLLPTNRILNQASNNNSNRFQGNEVYEDQLNEQYEIRGEMNQAKEDGERSSVFGPHEQDQFQFEDFEFSERLLREKMEESLDKNKLNVKYIMREPWKQVEAFLIKGEIIVSFEIFDKRSEHNRISLWNQFRPVNQIIMKNNLIEVNMHESLDTINNFQPLIDRLLSMQDNNAYQSAQMLVKHLRCLQEEQIIKQQVKEVYEDRISHLQWQIEDNFHKSKQIAYDLMEQLPEDAYYLYSIRRTNPTTLDSIFSALGYSKPFLRLFAGSEYNYQQFCLRQGFPEIFNGESRLQILLMNLLANNKAEITITTLDGYVIPIELRVHYHKLVPTEILPGIIKEDYMKIYQILIDTKYVDEIAKYRGLNIPILSEATILPTTTSNTISSIVPLDNAYQQSTQLFFEKFYAHVLNENKQDSSKDKPVNPMDPNNYTADFNRIFGNQNEGDNYLTSVFNTKITAQGTQSIHGFQEQTNSKGESLSYSQHSYISEHQEAKLHLHSEQQHQMHIEQRSFAPLEVTSSMQQNYHFEEAGCDQPTDPSYNLS